jgi:hypothetical protein
VIRKLLAIAAFLAIPCTFATAQDAAQPTQPVGNGGRPVGIAPDTNLPVIRQMKAARSINKLKAAPLYSFSEMDVDAYLKFLSQEESDPIQRVIHLARKNIGQPYEIYLLGEWPYENYDPDPMYCLEKSDCVTFVEHTYAMALSNDWTTFFKTLQRLRYKDGKIGMLTRNHETSADWDPNNAWLFDDITEKLGGKEATRPMHLVWKPSKFFIKFGLGEGLPDVTVESSFIPRDKVEPIMSNLKQGDIVHVVRGNDKDQYVGHFGMVAFGAKGEINMIHSADPAVREQGLLDYLEKNPRTLGYKFLRMKEKPEAIVAAEVK